MKNFINFCRVAVSPCFLESKSACLESKSESSPHVSSPEVSDSSQSPTISGLESDLSPHL